MDLGAQLATYAPLEGRYPWQSDEPWIRLTSEILLSRTRRSVVARVFPDFITRWPDAGALVTSDPDDVWDVIGQTGFRRRVEQLRATAQLVVEFGDVPGDRQLLLTLPGVGEYAADAVCLLAFEGQRMPLDMNVERVVGRLMLTEPTPEGRSPYRNEGLVIATDSLMSGSLEQRRAVFTGILELSANVCRPKPRCDECTLSDVCEFAHVARASEMRGG